MEIHPKKIIQSGGVGGGRYTKKMLQNLRMTEGRQVLHLKLVSLKLKSWHWQPPLPQTSPSPKQLSHTPPEGTDILLWFQPSTHTSPPRPQG